MGSRRTKNDIKRHREPYRERYIPIRKDEKLTKFLKEVKC